MTRPPVSVSIDHFVQDKPTAAGIGKAAADQETGLISGVTLRGLSLGADGRGSLLELLTARTPLKEPMVHAYQVFAEPGSVRAWVLHRWQEDRLAFTNGMFRVVLYDIRPDSPSYGQVDVLELGAQRKVMLTIPRFVVHGVQNFGSTEANFVNLPTNVYDPGNPDKFRLPPDHPGIPYRFR